MRSVAQRQSLVGAMRMRHLGTSMRRLMPTAMIAPLSGLLVDGRCGLRVSAQCRDIRHAPCASTAEQAGDARDGHRDLVYRWAVVETSRRVDTAPARLGRRGGHMSPRWSSSQGPERKPTANLVVDEAGADGLGLLRRLRDRRDEPKGGGGEGSDGPQHSDPYA